LTAPSIGPEWVKGGIASAISEATALGSSSRLDAHQVARKPRGPFPTRNGNVSTILRPLPFSTTSKARV